jgi:predicted O-linked N-acetylglucosamine transferase (SPINDLY family)
MVMKAGELSDPEICKQVMWHFLRAGITEDRITLIGNTNGQWHDHVSTYNLVDIGLDPFPHGSGVSGMESMMMGVPIVSLRWPTIVGRLSASLLSCVGYADWIAESADDYVKLAVKKAGDISLLSVRAQLRNDFLNSYIGNHKAYVKVVEDKYKKMWATYCKKRLDSIQNIGVGCEPMAQRATA